jgi:hypothetical protein
MQTAVDACSRNTLAGQYAVYIHLAIVEGIKLIFKGTGANKSSYIIIVSTTLYTQ